MAKSKSFDMIKDATMTFPEAKFFEPPKSKKMRAYKMKSKYDNAYEPYIRWSASPKQIRDPRTEVDFEKRWKLPKGHCSKQFRRRPDFHSKKMKYFWQWVFDKYPDVIYAVYQRAINKSTADAKIFSDIIKQRLEVDAPKPQMTPFVLVGVPQEKINNLFTPAGYEDAKKAEEAEVVSDE